MRIKEEYSSGETKEFVVTFDKKDSIPKEVEGVLKPYYRQYNLDLKVNKVVCNVEVDEGKMNYYCVANTNYGFGVPLRDFDICGRGLYSTDTSDCASLKDIDDIKDKIEKELMKYALETE